MLKNHKELKVSALGPFQKRLLEMNLFSFQFINEQFLFGSRPPQLNRLRISRGRHKGFRGGILPVCRSRKPAENADPGKKGHLWMEHL